MCTIPAREKCMSKAPGVGGRGRSQERFGEMVHFPDGGLREEDEVEERAFYKEDQGLGLATVSPAQ